MNNFERVAVKLIGKINRRVIPLIKSLMARELCRRNMLNVISGLICMGIWEMYAYFTKREQTFSAFCRLEMKR